MMNLLQIIVLAAGHGTRMRSTISKVLHPLGGRPVLHYALDLATSLSSQPPLLVLSPPLKETPLPFTVQRVIQDPPQGTGDAVKQALPFLQQKGHVLVLFGDTPLIQKETLDRMLTLAQEKPDLAVILLGMRPDDPQHYARLILSSEGGLKEVVESKDLTSPQRDIPLCNSGVMLIRADLISSLLSSITPANNAQEYYLTDLVKIANSQGYPCGMVEGDADEFMGINTRQDLANAEAALQARWRLAAFEQGVTLLDPSMTYFSYDTRLASDVTLHPGVVLGPGVVIEEGAEIYSFSQLKDAHVGKGARVGPFAHLRGGVVLQEQSEIGNFVEVKKSTFGPKAKAKHLSYIGDAEVGSLANLGAGTITCNYDGYTKSKTQIGEGVFIGSNSSLVAPLKVGDYAIVGAGSVVTNDIESGAMALSRTPQTTLDKGADRFRLKRQGRKDG